MYWRLLMGIWCFSVYGIDKFPLAIQVTLFVTPGAIDRCPLNVPDGRENK
jgi:hypothetical protein